MTAALPPLPEPGHRGPSGTGTYFDSFTGTQMHDYARQAIAAHLAGLAPDVMRLADEIARLDTERAMCLFVHDDNAAMDRAIRARDAARAALAALIEVKP